MTNRKKSSSIFVYFGIFLSSTVGFVYASAETRSNALKQQDSVQQHFPVKKLVQDTYEDITATYPLDAPVPSNIKTEIEYDPSTASYILRTYLGNIEIATPFRMTEQEYLDYSGRQEMQRYWYEKNSSAQQNVEDKFSVTDMKFDISNQDTRFCRNFYGFQNQQNRQSCID